MCVMCPQLIGMLDEVLNCSQCVFQPVSRLCSVGFIQAAFHLISLAGFFFFHFCFLLFFSFFAWLFKEYSCIVKIESSDSISPAAPPQKKPKQPRYCASREFERVE